MSLDRVRAPYNFVPVSPAVALFDAAAVGHDVPFSDGISGRLTLDIVAESPIFTRGSRDKTRFFTLPDGETRAIPGTSIKGMLRNVLEIASFGRLSRVNDHTFGVRDLHNSDLYTRHFTDIVGRYPVSMVAAGWLQLKAGASYDDVEAGEDGSPAWEIVPCHYAKVHYADLVAVARAHGAADFRPGDKQSAVKKYGAWAKGTAGLDAQAQVEVLARHGTAGLRHEPRLGDFGRVKRGTLAPAGAAPAPGATAGRLVFTGQPSYWDGSREGKNSPKHHDFFFYGAAGPAITVPFRVRQAFSHVHKGSGEQHRLDDNPNTEWKYWHDRLQRGERVPVFFLTKPGGGLRAMGLAQMFRLAYDHGTRAAVAHAQPGAFAAVDPGDPKLDLAELIFGRVGKDWTLRGRASFETAVEVGGAEELPPVSTVLGSPRASYYPHYLEQSTDPKRYGAAPRQVSQKSGRMAPAYQTYMEQQVRARGWKRYVQREVILPAPEPPRRKRDQSVNEDVVTTWRPLAAGARFQTHLMVHNLRPFELGALLWCLDFGGRTACRHGLGMARSLGYGKVRIELGGVDLRTVGGGSVDLDAARRAFETEMERQVPGWAGSDQLAQLVALATPIPADRNDDHRHMMIEHPRNGNEFSEAKKAGLALAPLVDPADVQRSRSETRSGAMATGTTPARAAGTTTSARAAPAAGGGRDRAADAPAAPMDPLERELREAQANGGHVALMRRWMDEKGDLEAARRAAAQRVIGQPSRQWKESKADVWAWLQDPK